VSISILQMKRESEFDNSPGYRVVVPAVPRWTCRRSLERWGWIVGVGLVLGGVWWASDWSVTHRGSTRDVQDAVERAQALSKAGDCGRAIEMYSGAIGMKPGDPAAHLGRGWCRLTLQDFVGAIEDARRARELGAPDGEVRVLIARAKTGLGSYREALAEFDAALAAGVGRQEVLLLRGAIQSELGNLDSACGDFDELIRLNPLQAMAFLLRGQTRLCQGRFDLALADYDALPKGARELSAAQLGRGVALLGLRRWEDALAQFDRALKSHRAQAGAWRGKAVALEALGRDDDAADAWREAGERPPEGLQLAMKIRGPQAADVAFFLRQADPSAVGAAAREKASSRAAAAR